MAPEQGRKPRSRYGKIYDWVIEILFYLVVSVALLYLLNWLMPAAGNWRSR